MKHAIAMLVLAIGVVPAAANDPTPTQVRLFTRTLSFMLPSGMILANDRNNGTNVLMEYVPDGETLATWTRLVTIQAYRGLGRSPMSTAAIARQAFFPAACQIGPMYHDGGERLLPNGNKRSVVANGCASLPAGAYPQALKGAGEQDFIYVFRDADNVYTLNYAVRGEPFTAKRPPVPEEIAETILIGQFGKVELQ
jgi:hypothetical protein